MKVRNQAMLALTCLLSTSLLADFRYQETTRITGGALVAMMKTLGTFSKSARQSMEPVTSTVLVQGNRMAHIAPESTQIVDLDQETITTLDHQKKQYTVMTFQQMRQRVEEARMKAEQQASQKAPQGQASDARPPQMNFKVNVRNTGASKQVAGLDSRQSILTMVMEATDQQTGQKGSLAFTNDMWMAPDVPGYSEVRDFNRRLAAKMGMVFGGAFSPRMAAMQPGSGEGMAEMVKEMSKLSGIPVMQVMRMGVTPNGEELPAASEAPLPESKGPEMPSAGEVAKESTASAIAGKLGGFGGFGGFGKKKKSAPPPEPTAPEQGKNGENAAQSVLLEISTESTAFSSNAIDASEFAIPAGYKMVAATDASHE